MDECLSLLVVLVIVLVAAGLWRVNSLFLTPDEVEEEVENALDALLMYEMDEEDDE